MSICPKHTQSYLFLWRFNDEGNPYVDSCIQVWPCKDPSIGHQVSCLALRLRFNGDARCALFHVPQGFSQDELIAFVEKGGRDVLPKLKKAQINPESLITTKTKAQPSVAAQFILNLEDECTCEECEE